MNFEEFLDSTISISYGGKNSTVKGRDFKQHKWDVEIIVNGGLEYKAELSEEDIKYLLKMAEEKERNTAYDTL